MTILAIALSLIVSVVTFKPKTDAALGAAVAVAQIPAAIEHNAAAVDQNNKLRAEIRDDIQKAITNAKPTYNVAYPVARDVEPARTHYDYVDSPSTGYLGE